MKKMKTLLLLMICTFVLLGTAACGSSSDAGDRTMNDATEGDSILDDAADDVTDGVDDVTDDVTDEIDKAEDELTQ